MRCPICKRKTEPKGSKFAPFCSERCKLIDLGDWAAEKFRIEVEPPDPGEGEAEQEP
jgi:endogenous inhibitor of DNA gyrase (YacG/DUF329 family)